MVIFLDQIELESFLVVNPTIVEIGIFHGCLSRDASTAILMHQYGCYLTSGIIKKNYDKDEKDLSVQGCGKDASYDSNKTNSLPIQQ